MQKHIKQLKDVEKFALRMATKSWDSGYQDFLSLTDIIPLEPQASLGMLFKIVHGLASSTQYDYQKAKSQSAYEQATTATTTICYIYTHLCYILFMRGTCFLSLVVNVPLQHLKSNIVNYSS